MDPRTEQIERGLPQIEDVLDEWGFSSQIPALRAQKKTEVIFWLENFQPSEINDALLILRKVQYKDPRIFRHAIASLSEELKRIFGRRLERARFFPLGLSPSSSGGMYLYDFRKDLNLDEAHFPTYSFHDIDKGIDLLVFFDDIIGSGSQAIRFFTDHLSGLRVSTYYVAIFAFHDGLTRVRAESGFQEVLAGVELSEEEKAFSDTSMVFPVVADRLRIKNLALKYGRLLYPAHPLGYDDSQALLTFPHNTPNNTLPIIWASPHNEKELGVLWNPLWERRRKLREPLVHAPDVTTYLEGVDKAFSRWQTRYVQLTTKERLVEIPLYAYEVDSADTTDEEEGQSQKQKELRHGLIGELWDTIDERRLLLLGEAGTGKTTTLQFLANRDATAARTPGVTQRQVPVYIELKTLTGDASMEERVFKTLNLPYPQTERLLIDGFITVYLDGLNEIMLDIRRKTILEIDTFLRKYERVPAMITSRQQSSREELFGVPSFILQGLSLTQIEEFLNKNALREDVTATVLAAVRRSRSLRRTVARPLFLLMLMNIVRRTGEVPATEGLIIRQFVDGLLLREREKDSDFDPDEFRLVMRKVALDGRVRKGENATMNLNEVLDAAQTRKSEYGLSINLLTAVRRAVDLGLLANDDDLYSFVHQVFQDYFVAEELAAQNPK